MSVVTSYVRMVINVVRPFGQPYTAGYSESLTQSHQCERSDKSKHIVENILTNVRINGRQRIVQK
uniref:Uncharacterized protein n=1 Tax=Romanomermis culicivorax TaxID=13658 RepID=A0A915KVX0_ROMCU